MPIQSSIEAHFIEYSVHEPSVFLKMHSHQLLPDWPCPLSSLLIVLQRCPFNLLEITLETEQSKHHCRQQFFALSTPIADQLVTIGHFAEPFDPRSGEPLRSHAGQLRLDDVAVIQAVLGYPTIDGGNCRVIIHPQWGSAIYPSVLASSATPTVLQSVVDRILSTNFLECHHSCNAGDKFTE